METVSLDALEDFEVEDAYELADLLDGGFARRKRRLSGADAMALIEASYNGTDPDAF